MQVNVSNSFIQKGCLFCELTEHILLFSTNYFNVVLDNFPLVEGHILILSKSHFGCAGEVPEDFFDELVELKATVAQQIGRAYAAPSFYEHGRAGSCVTFGQDDRLCHHFHLHALPLPTACDITQQLQQQFFQHKAVASFAQIPHLFQRYGEYLYFENSLKQGIFYPVAQKIPSHLLRTLIAQGLGHEERADWEAFNDEHLITNCLLNAQSKLLLT